jgi:DNA-binding MarR family transcriptional regulator
MKETYIEVVSLVERLHRHFLDLIKLQLDAGEIYDINNVQALILFNIGDAQMTISELMQRGCYLGSNASYNVKKMVENGYLSQERSMHDRRSIHVRLTDKGTKLCDGLQAMHQQQLELLHQSRVTEDDLLTTAVTLRQLEFFWKSAPSS